MTNRRNFIKKAVWNAPCITLLYQFPRPKPATYGYTGSVIPITRADQPYDSICGPTCQDFWAKLGVNPKDIATQKGGWAWIP